MSVVLRPFARPFPAPMPVCTAAPAAMRDGWTQAAQRRIFRAPGSIRIQGRSAPHA